MSVPIFVVVFHDDLNEPQFFKQWEDAIDHVIKVVSENYSEYHEVYTKWQEHYFDFIKTEYLGLELELDDTLPTLREYLREHLCMDIDCEDNDFYDFYSGWIDENFFKE